MRSMKPLFSVALSLACVTFAPIVLTAQTTYICTTTTRSTTVYSHDEFGNYYETTVTSVSKVCIPMERA